MNQDEFDKLLNWLDPDHDRAGQKYEDIRRGLIKIFERRGCSVADELADETIDRVIQKLDSIVDNYVGDPVPYFYGVAKYIYLEWLKRNPDYQLPPRKDISQEDELQYQCFEQCMEKLDKSSRKLIIDFYQLERRDKIEHRKKLALRLKISVHALHMRAHRIRGQLLDCIKECLERS